MSQPPRFSALQATQTPRRLTVLARILAWSFLLGPLVLLVMPWQQNIVGEGRVVAYSPTERQQSMEAPINGRIIRWAVQEGSRVKAGDTLLELSDLDADFSGRLDTQHQAVEARFKAKEDESRAYRMQLASLQAARDLQVTTAQNRLDVARQRTRSAEESLAATRATLYKTLSELEDSRVTLTRIQIDQSRQRNQVIQAPRDGMVLRVMGNTEGLVVKQGDPLLTLVPDTRGRAVELWVDGNDAPLITPGRPVRLQFEGWPAVQFGGYPEVAVGTFGGRVAFVDASDDGKGKFRLMVIPDEQDDLWPGERFLRQGGRSRGWILLGRVTVAYEIWRQLNAFPPLVMMEQPKTDLARKRLK